MQIKPPQTISLFMSPQLIQKGYRQKCFEDAIQSNTHMIEHSICY